MLNGRCYVVTDATIAGHVQRNSTTLSFYGLIVEITRRIIAFDRDAARISMYNMDGEHGPGGLMQVVHEMMNSHLGPGQRLDAITSTQMESMGGMLNEQIPADKGGIIVNLYDWQRHIFSISNTLAIYGPENIFAKYPELEVEFWKFEDGMLGLVVDIVPSITARKAHLARARVLAGLIEYVNAGSYHKASAIIQERVNTNLAYGFSHEMSGHAELVLMFGILGNAVPSSFWLVANIFSRPALLERIRDEVQTALQIAAPTKSNHLMLVSTKAVSMKSCPLLYSCYRETLRTISLLTSARLVLEDTMVAGKYLMKKDSIVQIAGGVVGQDPKVWGEDAHVFNPERFLIARTAMSESLSASPLPAGVPSAAFRAFGGGSVVCPGRHFAQSELMTWTAVLTLGFDITGPDGSVFVLPDKDDTKIPLSVMKPVHDPEVRIRRRKGWEYASWQIGL